MEAIDPKIVEEFERPGPRYTSYPTAPLWKNDILADDLEGALRTSIQKESSLSLYMHLPFCEKFCHFCACNKVIDPKREHAGQYQQAIQKELQILNGILRGNGIVDQMHWGGGTPTFYSPQELEEIFKTVEKNFKFSSRPEISVEVNPVVTTKEHLEMLSNLGFNRVSFGVQDFDLKVQDAINRHQTVEQTKELAHYSRQLNFESLNLDLIYGLPLQTIESISNTISHVLEMRPERIALYSYANVPWKYPFQRRFKDEDLPVGSQKISLYIAARKLLLDAGYDAIGMDHFALPQDELFQARDQKKLHRNFMGYTTRGDAQMISAGISSISMLDSFYAQNKKTLPSYYADIQNNRLPVERGLRLTQDDRIRRKVILDLMCNFEVDFASYHLLFDIDFRNYFKTELESLRLFEQKGLLQLQAQRLTVTSTGQLLVRNIAMVFDHYLDELSGKALFSKTI